MPVIKVDVCAGTHCTMMGSMDIIASVESLIELSEFNPDCKIQIKPVPCNNLCEHGRLAPIVCIDGQYLESADSETVMSRILEIARSRGCL
jgi:NADH:ubiquinone oxidoreductase subunit E